MELSNRQPHLAIAAIGAVLYLWGYAGQIQLATAPDSLRDRTDAYPVQFDGVTAATFEEVRFLSEGHMAGTEVEVTFATGERSAVTLPRIHSRAYLVTLLVSGFLFLWIGATVFGPRLANPAARDLFWGHALYGAAVMLGGVYFPKGFPVPDIVRGALQISCLAALPVVFLHLVLVFPRRHEALDRVRWLFPLLWAFAVTVVVWQQIEFIGYFRSPSPDTHAGIALPVRVADISLVLQVLAAVAILAFRLRTASTPREQSLIRSLFVGIGIGITPYVFLRTLPAALGLPFSLPPLADRVAELAIPVAFATVVVRNRFLDIDIVARRYLIYSGISGGAILIAFAGLALVTLGFRAPLADWRVVPVFALGLLGGFLFRPVRRGLGRWVDRTFFRIRRDYEDALARFAEKMDRAPDQESLVSGLRRFVIHVVSVEGARVVLRREDERVTDAEPAPDLFSAALAVLDGHGERTRFGCVAAAETTNQPDLETAAFPTPLVEAGFPLVVDLCAGDDSLGAILVGPKRTGRQFVDPDLAILRRAGAVAGEALVRMRLVQEMEQVRIKNRFFARVAHDLRTPLTSVTWSAQNLLDGVVGDLTDRQREYLSTIKTSAGYLGGLVNNLLEIGRLDQNRVETALEDLDLRAPVDQAVVTVTPLAADKDVRIQVEAGAETLLRSDPDKIVEIAVNLLDNAVRFSPEGGVVHVRVGELAGGGHGLVVRDEGPGLRGADPDELFDLFTQGATSPHSGRHGFGLGLYIVRTLTELLGGSVSAADHPDGGAVFTCRFDATEEVSG